ncbi:MAG: acetylglutamate kinase [Acidobacteriota bacterium]
MKHVSVLKLGGELIENEQRVRAISKAITSAAKLGRLVIVHGGGRDIDTALAQVGIPKRQVDGLRVTDADTLNIVVSVLAGTINTRFVAAINAAGGHAIGLTGADSGVAPVEKAAPHKATNGETVDLGMVGMPIKAPAPAVIEALCKAGFVPVIACISAGKNGKLFNVNADTLAGSLAARLQARRLVIAGATPGVLDKKNQTILKLDKERIEKLVKSGTANAGMVAKLNACQVALKGGTKSVVIIDGRAPGRLVKALSGQKTSATTKVVS